MLHNLLTSTQLDRSGTRDFFTDICFDKKVGVILSVFIHPQLVRVWLYVRPGYNYPPISCQDYLWVPFTIVILVCPMPSAMSFFICFSQVIMHGWGSDSEWLFILHLVREKRDRSDNLRKLLMPVTGSTSLDFPHPWYFFFILYPASNFVLPQWVGQGADVKFIRYINQATKCCFVQNHYKDTSM